MTKKVKNKEPIRIREKRLNDGSTSLYLDTYISGRRKYEFLHLYLVPERTKADREKNKQTWQLAEAVKAQRIVELQSGRFGFEGRQSQVRFFDYFEQCAKQYKGGTRRVWLSSLHSLRKYEKNKDIRLADIDREWVQGYYDYICSRERETRWGEIGDKRKLSANTMLNYQVRLNICLNKAVKEGLIQKNPAQGIERVKRPDSKRCYLTIDEVQRLTQTECVYEGIKRMFLFGCLTGLRYSDISKLTWGEVSTQGGYTRITFKQKKTKMQMYLDINPQAVALMGERGRDDELVFRDNHDVVTVNRTIKRWAEKAGITKNVTFHSSRHTFAVMMLDLGVDLYTVSKLLGHRSIATTQIYAKVLDKARQAAVSLIPDILGSREEKTKGEGE